MKSLSKSVSQLLFLRTAAGCTVGTTMVENSSVICTLFTEPRLAVIPSPFPSKISVGMLPRVMIMRGLSSAIVCLSLASQQRDAARFSFASLPAHRAAFVSQKEDPRLMLRIVLYRRAPLGPMNTCFFLTSSRPGPSPMMRTLTRPVVSSITPRPTIPGVSRSGQS